MPSLPLRRPGARDMAAYLDRQEAGARDFIVRVGWNALRLRDTAGDPFDLIATLRTWQTAPGHADQPQEWAVQALCDRARSPRLLPLRLIILPLPPDKTAIRQKKLRRTASKHQNKLDPRSLLAAGFLILATSLPDEIPAAEICAAYRLRWQIELAFKRLKSLINIDRIPTHTEAGGLSWLYPHLILALLTDDACQDFLAFSPEHILAAGYSPSLWRACKIVVGTIRASVFGCVTLPSLLDADPSVHQILAEPRRRRKRQSCSFQCLS